MSMPEPHYELLQRPSSSTEQANSVSQSAADENSTVSARDKERRYEQNDAIIGNDVMDHDESERMLHPQRHPLSPERSALRDVSFGNVELLSPWFPEVDPDHKRAKTLRRHFSKRNVVLWTAFVLSTIVLSSNVACVWILGSKYAIKSNRGVVPLYEGDCRWVKAIGVGGHLGINILSSLLLYASHLCMQLLVAPTREEVDKAHRKKIWLDIGILSWRNFKNLSKRRKVLWVCLALSSLPLHFLYNSAISTSIAQYGYPTIVASESFLHGAPVGNFSKFMTEGVSEKFNQWPSRTDWDGGKAFKDMQTNALNTTVFEKLSNKQCIEKYSNVFAKRASLIVVTEDKPGDDKASVHQYIFWPAQWGGWSRYSPCNSLFKDGVEVGINIERPGNPDCQTLDHNTPEIYDNWQRFDRTVLYCLSQRIDDHCRANYSPALFIVVCCFSAVKCICILVTIRVHKKPALCTIGDAVASFLEDPDRTSTHMGAVTKSMFSKSMFSKKPSSSWSVPMRTTWRPKSLHWYSAPSKTRWFITIPLCIFVLVAAVARAIPGSHGTTQRSGKGFSWQMKQPIGLPDPLSFTNYSFEFHGIKGFLSHVLFANMWQVIISLLYPAYNALLTCMLISEEWSGYATDRKPLRVTHPRGIQRSTYNISLPYKYAIPLMIANTTLHWLVSQSLFIVSAVCYYPNFVEDKKASYTITGYSVSATIISICVSASTMLILIAVSLKKIPNNIPLVSTCSIAISAACHRHDADVDVNLLPVQWGVVSAPNENPARCAFTTLRTVRSPIPGEKLGGKSNVCEID